MDVDLVRTYLAVADTSSFCGSSLHRLGIRCSGGPQSELSQQLASGYVPKRTVGALLDKGILKIVPRAPVFSYPAYVAYPSESETYLVEPVLKILHLIAETQNG